MIPLSTRRVAVVGGGIAGLALANRICELKKEKGASYEVSLFEAGQRVGGTIESELRDGFVLEKGPDSFISDKPWALELSKRIGLESEIIGTNPENRKSFIVRKNKLIPVPEGFYLVSPTQLWPFVRSPLFSIAGKLRMGLEPFIPKNRDAADESIGSFIRRRFGRETLERAGQPMLAGIYTGDPDTLSLQATMPRFKKFEDEQGSVLRGLLMSKKSSPSAAKASGPRYSLFLSYKEGMETLTKTLAARIPAGVIHTASPVRRIVCDHLMRRWMLWRGQETVSGFDVVCFTLDAWKSAELLRPENVFLARKLESIPYESVATLNLAFRRADIPHALDGFGFVVPSTEKRTTIACTFSSQKFAGRVPPCSGTEAPEGHALLRAFVGGAFGRRAFEMTDAEITRAVLSDLRDLLGVSAPPLFVSLQRYPHAMVQYRVGHLDLMKSIDIDLVNHPGLYLTGSAYRGVGIPDCIHEAELTAEKIHDYLTAPRLIEGDEF